jgi:AcrR family transcriptional regulator
VSEERPRPRGRPPRRRQAERSAATREALLDATIACVVRDGYARTTTGAVAREAGVSVGAIQHHFSGKAELMAGAVAHLLARRQDEFAKAIAGLDPGADRVDAAIDVLWSMYESSAFVAWLELWVASRTDADLRAAVLAMNDAFIRSAQAQFAEVVGDLPGGGDPAHRAGALAFTMAVFDGTAISALLGPQPTKLAASEMVDAVKALSRLSYPRPAPEEGSP